jgi:hypothetical protein
VISVDTNGIHTLYQQVSGLIDALEGNMLAGLNLFSISTRSGQAVFMPVYRRHGALIAKMANPSV